MYRQRTAPLMNDCSAGRGAPPPEIHFLRSWLTTPGPVLLKRHVRNSKMDPLVEEVDLIEANPRYAYISFPDGC